jgi:aerobic carbon-monoxide dehydrogenase medium subunit
MKPVQFDYFAPDNLEEALDHLNELGYSGKVLAGGQSLIPTMNFRMSRPGALVDLNRVAALQYIRPSADGGLAIGTMTRDSVVEHNADVLRAFPLIGEVMPNIAHPQIRNRGTFGGAIAHADPAGQLPAVALTLNANMKIMKKGLERVVGAEDFFLGPFMTSIEPDEMLVEVQLPPLAKGSAASYQQFSRQKGGYAQAAAVTLVTVGPDGRCTDVRMSLISMAEVPVLSKEAQRILVGQKPTPEAFETVAEAAVKKETDPGSDVHATADYRRHLCKVLIVRSLTEAFARAVN